MPEEVLYILFIFMAAAVMVNIVCAIDHKKAEKTCESWAKLYRDLAFTRRRKFWEEQGAREAEDGSFYIDLGGGMRLVIFEGKIDGWYFCEESDFEKKRKEAEHRAEVFERMAFEACEERDAAIWAMKKCADACEVCAYFAECSSTEEDPDCLCCNEACPCITCVCGESRFVLDKKKVRELMRKESEKE